MKKLNWQYRNNGGITIEWEHGTREYNKCYFLISKYSDQPNPFFMRVWDGSDWYTMSFKKLSSAKRVAELIKNG